MSLQEEFENEKNIKAIVDEVNDEYGSMYVFDPVYIEWLEEKVYKLQKSHNNEYVAAKKVFEEWMQTDVSNRLPFWGWVHNRLNPLP